MFFFLSFPLFHIRFPFVFCLAVIDTSNGWMNSYLVLFYFICLVAMHDGPVLFQFISICLSISVFGWHLKRLVAFHFFCCEYAQKRRISNKNGVLGVWEENLLSFIEHCIYVSCLNISMEQAGVRDVTTAFSYYYYYIVTTTTNNVMAWFMWQE